MTDQFSASDVVSAERHTHIVGVGGAGMSAIATVLRQMGQQVSGSDQRESSTVDRLRKIGVSVTVGHAAHNIAGADVVVISTAVSDSNVEVVAAGVASVPVLRRDQMLAAITQQRRSIAVAGTHGKTTTSSFLALALRSADLDPSFVIGAEVAALDASAYWGESDLFVVEADESDGTFLRLDRTAAVVTSVEPDHIAYYGSEAAMVAAFVQFVKETDGPVAVCIDDVGASALLAVTDSTIGYGTHEDAAVRISKFVGAQNSCTFTIVTEDGEWPVSLTTPGLHNAQNATAAFAIAVALGADVEGVVSGLEAYTGVARRFELRGIANGITFVDDYAHLPTEVEAVLAAAKDGGWGRVVAVFQPHRFSRTAEVHAGFAGSFVNADVVVVTDIFASGEAPVAGVTGKLVADAALAVDPSSHVVFLPRREDLVTYLMSTLRAGDLCLTLGAGDLTTLPDELILQLAGER